MLRDLALRFPKDILHPSRGQVSLRTMRGHGSNEEGVTSARQPSSPAEQKPPKYVERLAGASRALASWPHLCCDTARLRRGPPRLSDLSAMCCHRCSGDSLVHPVRESQFSVTHCEWAQVRGCSVLGTEIGEGMMHFVAETEAVANPAGLWPLWSGPLHGGG